MSDFQEDKLHLLDIIEYYLVITPEFLVMLLPIMLLLALLYTLTNHARHNEITAMRAAGVSLWRLCVPYFVMGSAVSLVLFVLNEWCVPRSADWAERILSRYVQKPDEAEKKTEFATSASPMRGAIAPGSSANITVKTGRNAEAAGEMDVARRFDPLSACRPRRCAPTACGPFSTWQEYSQADASRATRAVAVKPMSWRCRNSTKPRGKSKAKSRSAAYQNLRSAHRADIPLTDIWRYLRLHPNLPPADSGWLFTKLHGRLAAPWTCLVVVLIAIPFGAASGRRNLFVGVAGSIFICFAYFVIQQVSLALGSGGHLPAWLAAWLPNLIFGVTGWY